MKHKTTASHGCRHPSIPIKINALTSTIKKRQPAAWRIKELHCIDRQMSTRVMQVSIEWSSLTDWRSHRCRSPNFLKSALRISSEGSEVVSFHASFICVKNPWRFKALRCPTLLKKILTFCNLSIAIRVEICGRQSIHTESGKQGDVLLDLGVMGTSRIYLLESEHLASFLRDTHILQGMTTMYTLHMTSSASALWFLRWS